MRTSLVTDALQMAIDAGHTHPKSIFHADRGSQYTSAEFARFCDRNDVRRSLGRIGVCWDSAVADAFFAALKNDLYYRYSWPTRARARFAVADSRVHRGLVQPPQTALQPRLPHPHGSPHRPPSSSNRRLINNVRSCPREAPVCDAAVVGGRD